MMFVKVSKLDLDIIMKSKYSLLYLHEQMWEKKNGKNMFDITMGSHDGAESCMTVRLLILHKLQKINFNVGLYRDNGLGVSDLNPRQLELTKKKSAGR